MLLYIFYNNFKCTDTEKLAKYPCPTRTRHGRIRIQTCRICTQPKKFDFLFRARHGHGRAKKKRERERTVEKPGILSGDPRTVDPPRR